MFRGGRDERQLFRLVEHAVDSLVLYGQLIGKARQIALYGLSRLMLQIRVVEIPLKSSLPQLFQFLKQLLLRLQQFVKPHKDIHVTFKHLVFPFSHIPI